MFFVTRGLPFFLELGLLVFCLIDVVQTPPQDCRNLGKAWWIVLIIIVPLVGAIAWLVAGRPQRNLAALPRASGARVTAPDDDPEFLAQLRTLDEEQGRTLGQWEADLKRREQELRQRQAETNEHRDDGGDEGWVERKQP